MLNEFKRSMWNDGYSKEQPWLNYFNSYERMHCCFEGDGASGSGSGGVGTGGPGVEDDIVDVAPADFSIGPGTGMESDLDPDALSTDTPGLSAAEAAEAAAAADALGLDATQAEQQAAIDVATVDFAMENEPDLYGYNDLLNMDYFAKSEVADYASMKNDALSVEANAKSKGYDVSVTVDKDGTYSYTGPDAAAAMAGEMGTAAGKASGMMGIGGMFNALNNEFSTATDPTFGPALSYNEETARSDKDFAESMADFAAQNAERGSFSTPSFGDINDREAATDLFSMQDKEETAFDTFSGFVGQLASYPVDVATDIITGVADFLGKAVSQVTTTEVDTALGKTQSNSQGAYAQGVNTRDTPFGSMTFDSRDAAMGFNNDYDEGGEDAGMVLPFIPTPEPEEEKEPRTAMEAYFDRMGIPSKPKRIPGRSFDFGVPPRPVNYGGDSSSNNNDIFSQEAARRRQMAMATPKYREPSGINSSIAIFAAANGMSYEEAALRFAPPSVPKEPVLDRVLPTPFAASGGGLNSLMRYK